MVDEAEHVQDTGMPRRPRQHLAIEALGRGELATLVAGEGLVDRSAHDSSEF
jgi:hypothetical protein